MQAYREFQKAVAVHRRGDLDEAARLYRQVLRIEPAHSGAAHMLGAVYLQQDDAAGAERWILRALAVDPDIAEALSNLGTARKKLGKLDAALESYDRAIALRPDYPEALASSANTLCLLGRDDEALERYSRAIALKPDHAEAYYNRGALFEARERLAEAVADYEHAIALKPGFAEAHNNLGNALLALHRPEEALASFERALQVRRNDPAALTNRGNVLASLGRLGEALSSHDAALALAPDFARAFNNRGSVLREMRRLDEAAADYRHALALAPDCGEAEWNLALTRLLVGDWAEGWARYEARFTKAHPLARKRTDLAPEWTGQDVAGKRVLLVAEQGYGDAIQFVRFARVLADRGAAVTMMARRRLHRLVSSIGDVTFVSEEETPQADYQIALMSVPRVLGLTRETVPGPVPYLRTDGARADIWRARLGEQGFKVGICWQGNPSARIDHGRSIPLAEFAPLAEIDGVRLISLQKIDGLDQLDRKPPGMIVETPGHAFDGGEDAFVDTAAIMANLDLIVTSDTAVAHLAGALGRPVWTVLKAVPDWRWLLDRDDTPWYPTMRLFRQARAGDWADVMARVAEALAPLVREAGGGDIQSVA